MIDWGWVTDSGHLALFRHLSAQHIQIALLSVLYGLAVSLPLGVLCARYPRLYTPVLALTTIAYSIPSIALFVVLIDFTGVSNTTAIIPLTVYATSILVRNVVDGLRSIPDSVAQAATAMGFGAFQRLVRVDLPIALPVVFAGLRIATVSSVSLVAIAGLIGIGGLGDLFVRGAQIFFPTEIYVGIVLVVVIALAADALIVLAGRLLTPWARARKAS